jgi:hypothetical protein
LLDDDIVRSGVFHTGYLEEILTRFAAEPGTNELSAASERGA